MKLYTNNGNVIEAKATRYPMMSGHRGHIWDNVDITINDVTITGKIDVEWGQYAYFIYNGRCYKISIYDVNYDAMGTIFTKLFTSKDCVTDDVQYEEELFNAKFIRTFRIWNNKRYYAKTDGYEDDIKRVWNEVIEDGIDYNEKTCLDFESFIYALKNPSDIIVMSLQTLFRVKGDNRLMPILQKGL